LTARQKELLQEFEQSMHESNMPHSPKSKSWLDSVKKFFEDLAT